ncbi:MAG: hypothetical protein AAF481_13405 [Acidobacteriota bacterium]
MSDTPDRISAALLNIDEKEAERLVRKAMPHGERTCGPNRAEHKIVGLSLASEGRHLAQQELMFLRLHANGLAHLVGEAHRAAREMADRLGLPLPEAADRVMNRMIEEKGR